MKKIHAAVEKLGREGVFCAAGKILFEELEVLKGDDVDVDAAKKYLDENIPEMADTFKTALTECVELTKDKSEEYAKESGVRVSDCDPKHEMVAVCLLITVGGVREIC